MSDSDVVRHYDVVTHVHSCAECPDAIGTDVCNQAPGQADLRTQNAHALTPSCPQWPWSTP
jgi:hypothetical protein